MLASDIPPPPPAYPPPGVKKGKSRGGRTAGSKRPRNEHPATAEINNIRKAYAQKVNENRALTKQNLELEGEIARFKNASKSAMEAFRCNICFATSLSPRVLVCDSGRNGENSCNQFVCEKCCGKLLEPHDPKCPFCRGTIIAMVFPRLDYAFDAMRRQCPNKNCEFWGEKTRMDAHALECPHFLTKCTNEGCTDVFPRSGSDSHAKLCAKTHCPHSRRCSLPGCASKLVIGCPFQSTPGEMKAHLNKCAWGATNSKMFTDIGQQMERNLAVATDLHASTAVPTVSSPVRFSMVTSPATSPRHYSEFDNHIREPDSPYYSPTTQYYTP